MARAPLPYDPDRFRIERRHLFGPFYALTIIDLRTGKRVPHRGAVLIGEGSVNREIRWGLDRYQRRHPELFIE